jgi:hypothetical protein
VKREGFVAVDYGGGVRRWFSEQQVRHLCKLLHISRKSLRRVTRKWALSCPDFKRRDLQC